MEIVGPVIFLGFKEGLIDGRDLIWRWRARAMFGDGSIPRSLMEGNNISVFPWARLHIRLCYDLEAIVWLCS